MGTSQRVSKPSLCKSQETAPNPSQPVSKAHSEKLAQIQTGVSNTQFLIPGTTLYPYLIAGCEPWDADEFVREKLRGIHATHGKHGAAGTVFHIYVDTFD